MKLRSSLVHAFLGRIDSKVRGVQMSYENANDTKITCYIEGELTEEEREEICEIETEIICDFGTPYNEINIWVETIGLDSPKPLPHDYSAAEWFYIKKECQ